MKGSREGGSVRSYELTNGGLVSRYKQPFLDLDIAKQSLSLGGLLFFVLNIAPAHMSCIYLLLI